MQAFFSEDELLLFESKIWWVACTSTPYLVRSAVYETNLLLSVTDLRSMWVTRIDKPTLLKQKEKFARTLQVSDFDELLGLFARILSNPESKALYQFYKKSEDLCFKIQKQIEVYPLEWKFELIRVQCDIAQMMCKDIINPMARTLQAQERRFHIINKKMEILERDLLKKMSEAEKKNYKSVCKEDEEDLKLLVPPVKQSFISELRFDTTTKLLFENALSANQSINKSSAEMIREKGGRVEAKGTVYLAPKAEQLINELEMKKQEEKHRKKKKVIDFL